MDKRAILAIILTFLIIILWGVVQSKFFPQPPSQPSSKEVKKEEGLPTKVEKLGLKEEKKAAKKKTVIKKEVSIETPDYWAVFTTEDARLKHFKLKKFEDRVDESSLTTSLTRFVKELLGGKVEERKKPMPLDLVNTNEEEGLPLGLTLLPFPSDGSWEVDKDKLHLVNGGEKGEIIFSKHFENGLKVAKRFGEHPLGGVRAHDEAFERPEEGVAVGRHARDGLRASVAALCRVFASRSGVAGCVSKKPGSRVAPSWLSDQRWRVAR